VIEAYPSVSRECRRVRLSLDKDGRRSTGPRGLPFGTRPVDHRSVGEVEEAFQQAMDRCRLLRLAASSFR
jgi:hypothetical protein